MRVYNLAVLEISNPMGSKLNSKDKLLVEVLFYSGDEKETAHTRNCPDAVQRSTKSTCRMVLSWIQYHQSTLQNKKGITMNVVQCHGFTNDNSENDKD